MEHFWHRHNDRMSQGQPAGMRSLHGLRQDATGARHDRPAASREGIGRGKVAAGSGRLRALVLKSIRAAASRMGECVARLASGRLPSGY
jgi:hypothetical protein